MEIADYSNNYNRVLALCAWTLKNRIKIESARDLEGQLKMEEMCFSILEDQAQAVLLVILYFVIDYSIV